jgi:trehalose-phosphatase
MKYLFNHYTMIKRLLSNRQIFLFLDYDGTLIPIRDKPGHAIISKRVEKLLLALSKTPGCKLAIISDRSLKNISSVIGLDNIIYSGNHGLELKGPGIRFNSPVSKKHKAIISGINRGLHKKLTPIKGALIENKGLSLAVHYRLVTPKQVPLVKTIFHQITSPHRRRNEIRIRMGKMLIEVCPAVNWDKGKAVSWLMRNASFKPSVMPVYIGDDITDEDAFKILKDSGLTVFVGRPTKSHAKYYVKNTGEVLDFLKTLCGENC